VDESSIFDSRAYRDGPVTYVVPRGEVDLANSAAFGAALLVASERATRVVIDMSKLTFFDLSAIRELAHVCAVLAERGVGLSVMNVPALVVRMLELTEVYDCFDLIEASPSAVQVRDE
jgi:anti-anti-sigma factor